MQLKQIFVENLGEAKRKISMRAGGKAAGLIARATLARRDGG
jgi:hypothetical protein